MPAANTDKLRKKKSLFQTTLNGGIGAGDTSLTLQSGSGLPTDTAITMVINRVNANGVATPSAMEVVTGTLSGSTLSNLVRAEDATTAKSHANASVVEMVWDAETWNDFVDAYVTEHNQDGTHKFQSLTAKTTPVDADSVPLVDSAASNVLKRVTWANIKATIWTALGALIAAGTAKTTLADADSLAIQDSAASNATKQITWANIMVAIAAYTATLTNKRVTPRIGTEASSATSTPTGDSVDHWTITALAAADAIAAPTGTPTDGQKLVIRIKDNGTARALTWNAIYRAGTDVTLPATTVLSKTLYCAFMYNSADTKWDLLAVVDNI